MATYDELRALIDGDVLLDRVVTATIIAAEAEITASPGTDNGRVWGLNVLSSPKAWGLRVYYSVLAANNNLPVAQITGATDNQIQTNVDAAVPGLIAAHATAPAGP